MKRVMFFVICPVVVSLLPLAFGGLAWPPGLVSYQQKITDADGSQAPIQSPGAFQMKTTELLASKESKRAAKNRSSRKSPKLDE